MNALTSTPILVVEQFTIMGRIVRSFLRQLGFNNVDLVSDGAAALDKMRSGSYGLLIPDWNLRPMSGADLVARVRADADLKDTPVLMLMPAVGNLVGGDGGADFRLPKPFDVTALGNALAALLSG